MTKKKKSPLLVNSKRARRQNNERKGGACHKVFVILFIFHSIFFFFNLNLSNSKCKYLYLIYKKNKIINPFIYYILHLSMMSFRVGTKDLNKKFDSYKNHGDKRELEQVRKNNSY